eukprot:scaffold142191_cov47-Prasinocladus_malaysianus.AAC.1
MACVAGCVSFIDYFRACTGTVHVGHLVGHGAEANTAPTNTRTTAENDKGPWLLVLVTTTRTGTGFIYWYEYRTPIMVSSPYPILTGTRYVLYCLFWGANLKSMYEYQVVATTRTQTNGSYICRVSFRINTDTDDWPAAAVASAVSSLQLSLSLHLGHAAKMESTAHGVLSLSAPLVVFRASGRAFESLTRFYFTRRGVLLAR